MKSLIRVPLMWFKRHPALLAVLFGLGMSFLPMFLGLGKLLPGDRGDGRLNLYFLEYGYGWLSGDPARVNFWDAPFFYPAINTMAYSDVLLGIAPVYWLGRVTGLDEFASLQVLYLALYLLNFGAMYWLLRKVCQLSSLGAALGALLFAFSPPRNYAMGHIQTAGTFYIPLLWGCLIESFRCGKADWWRRAGWIFGAAACGVALFYAGFYIFFFTALGSGIFVAALLLTGEGRGDILTYCRRNWPVLATAALLSALLIQPGAAHYRMASRMFPGDRPFASIEFPSLATFINTASFFYKAVLPAAMAKTFGSRMGIGIITLLAVWYGLYRMGRRSVYLGALGATAAVLLLLTLDLTAPWLWRPIYELAPGAHAIRIASRVILVLLLIYGFALAWLVDALPGKFRWVLLLVIAIEFAGTGYVKWDAVAEKQRMHRLEAAVPAGREPLLLSSDGEKVPYYTDLDAMWLGLKTGRPVINGYSGNQPPGYAAMRSLQPGAFDNLPSSAVLVVREKADGVIAAELLRR